MKRKKHNSVKKVSVIFLAQIGYWFARKSFESTGFTIKEKLTEFIIPDAPKEYIKTIMGTHRKDQFPFTVYSRG